MKLIPTGPSLPSQSREGQPFWSLGATSCPEKAPLSQSGIMGSCSHSLRDSENPLPSWQCSMRCCSTYQPVPTVMVPTPTHGAPAGPTPPESSGPRHLCPRAILLLIPQATSRFLVVGSQNWLTLGLPASNPWKLFTQSSDESRVPQHSREHTPTEKKQVPSGMGDITLYLYFFVVRFIF